MSVILLKVLLIFICKAFCYQQKIQSAPLNDSHIRAPCIYLPFQSTSENTMVLPLYICDDMKQSQTINATNVVRDFRLYSVKKNIFLYEDPVRNLTVCGRTGLIELAASLPAVAED